MAGTVLFCHCAYAAVVPARVKAQVLAHLAASDRELVEVQDLCELAARGDAALAEHARRDGLEVVACYPRAVRWLFHGAGAELADGVPVHNMRARSAQEIAAALGLDGAAAVIEEPQAAGDSTPPSGWRAWYPVIDFERCTNCMQCLSFCLFGVFGIDAEGEIEVQAADKCKNNCPACARVCPDVAILFPKYARGPINGDEVEEDAQQGTAKVDVSALLGGDLYAALRERSQRAKQRFSTERDESRALLERKRCLRELQGELDIPDEVLMSLPSAGEIAERLERAEEKRERLRSRSRSVRDQGDADENRAEEWDL